jgi:hypothetical protein
VSAGHVHDVTPSDATSLLVDVLGQSLHPSPVTKYWFAEHETPQVSLSPLSDGTFEPVFDCPVGQSTHVHGLLTSFGLLAL